MLGTAVSVYCSMRSLVLPSIIPSPRPSVDHGCVALGFCELFEVAVMTDTDQIGDGSRDSVTIDNDGVSNERTSRLHDVIYSEVYLKEAQQ